MASRGFGLDDDLGGSSRAGLSGLSSLSRPSGLGGSRPGLSSLPSTSNRAPLGGSRAPSSLAASRRPQSKEDIAATKLQATYRGHATRMKNPLPSKKQPPRLGTAGPSALSDRFGRAPSFQPAQPPGRRSQTTVKRVGGGYVSQEAAAIRIQSSYRGHQDRKKIRQYRGTGQPLGPGALARMRDPLRAADAYGLGQDIGRGPSRGQLGGQLGGGSALTPAYPAYGYGQQNQPPPLNYYPAQGQGLGLRQGAADFLSQRQDAQPLAHLRDKNFHELHRAATKIQASYRGARDRRNLKDRTATTHDARLMRKWEAFALRQREKHVPLNTAYLEHTPVSSPYRLRLESLELLPLPQIALAILRTPESYLEIHLSASLFDEATGSFFGSTARSQPAVLTEPLGSRTVNVAVKELVFFHSCAADERVSLVVEVVLSERRGGVVQQSFAVAWAGVPLLRRNPAGRLAPMPLGERLSVPLCVGSARYILWGRPRSGFARPSMLEAASLTYAVEGAAALIPAMPLVPEDALLTKSDVVPGLMRFSRTATGELTTATNSYTINSLASPILAPTRRLVLNNVAVGMSPVLMAFLAPSDFPGTPVFELKASIHNGRTFVGKSHEVVMQWDNLPGLLRCPVPLQLECHEDVWTVLVMELYYSGGPLLPGAQTCVGWGFFVLFDPYDRTRRPSPGHLVRLRTGNLECRLRSGPGRWLRDVPVLDWRAIVGPEDPSHPHTAAPAVYCQLSEERPPEFRPDAQATIEMIRHGAIEEQRRIAGALQQDPRILALQGPQQGYPQPQQQGPPLLGVMAAQQAQQLGAISAMQQAQLAQLAAAQGADQRVMSLVAAQQQQQIAALAAAMQEQLNQLARSVQVLGGGLGRDDDAAALQRRALSSQMPGRQANALPTPQQLLSGDGLRGMDGPAAARMFSGSNSGPKLSLGEGHPSRATRAALHLAGGQHNLPADVLAAMEGRVPPPAVTNPDTDLEGRDVRLVNDVMIQVLALRRVDALNVPLRLRTVYLTFQLFDFPPTITPPTRLDGGEGPGSVCMLQPERTVHNHPGANNGPGLLFKYRVAPEEGDDPSTAQESRMTFVRYLARGTLTLDLWDAESLLQVGTATVDIRQLLRQGRDMAESLQECPVLDHREALPEEAQRNRLRRAALHAQGGTAAGPDGLAAPPPVARATLLVRLINVGRTWANIQRVPPPMGPGAVEVSVPGGAKRVRIRSALEADTAVASELQHSHLEPSKRPPLGSDGSVSVLLRRNRADVRSALSAVEERRLRRLERLKEIRGDSDRKPLGPEELRLVVREKVFEDVADARDRTKRSVVMTALRRGMASARVLRPMYGELVFFEHEFKNATNADGVFEARKIRCVDAELRLVTSTFEWRALRGAAGLAPMAPGIEDDALAGHRVFAMAGESVLLPFKYQSFAASASPVPGPLGNDRVTRGALPEIILSQKNISVLFHNMNTQEPAGALEVEIRPRPMVIDRTFRFHASEQDILKQRMSVPPGPNATGAGPGSRAWAALGPGELSVRCSDPDVAVGVTHSQEIGVARTPIREGGISPRHRHKEEIYLKFKCPPAPDARQFFVTLYKDRFQAHLAETWQVFVHARRRTDMSALVGQTAHSSVVLRGLPTSRRVLCFSSHPDELTVAPADGFILPAHSLTEMQLSFRPLVAGRLDILVHVVDADTRELVHPLLVCTDARAPTVSRTFEVELPKGIKVHKKITYANPYSAPRRFHLRSTHPGLVSFRPDVLELGPHAARAVGVTLEGGEEWGAAAQKAQHAEVLVFVNDDTDTNEECFRLRIHFI